MAEKLLKKLIRQFFTENSKTIEEGAVHNLATAAMLATATLAPQNSKLAPKETVHYIRKVWTPNQTSLELYDSFFNDFLSDKINRTSFKKNIDYIRALRKISESDIEMAISHFKKAHYKQELGKPNKEILQLQVDLVNNKANGEIYATPDGKPHKFKDGIFGLATAKAMIRLEIAHLIEAGPNKEYLMGKDSHNATKVDFKDVNLNSDDKINKQVQSIK